MRLPSLYVDTNLTPPFFFMCQTKARQCYLLITSFHFTLSRIIISWLICTCLTMAILYHLFLSSNLLFTHSYFLIKKTDHVKSSVKTMQWLTDLEYTLKLGTCPLSSIQFGLLLLFQLQFLLLSTYFIHILLNLAFTAHCHRSHILFILEPL